MKCPLLKKNVAVWSFDVMDCLGRDCAWWDEEKNCCSVKTIAKELTRIQLKISPVGGKGLRGK